MIVNIDEFSELCGVTSETMRGYVRAVDGTPAWLIERGDKGRPYRIDTEGGLAWWKALRDEGQQAEADRQAQLQQLRLDILGDQAESEDMMALSGKARKEEYSATMERIKLRRIMGELVETGDLVPLLSHAAVEARRRLQMVPGEYAAQMGLTPEDVKPLRDLIEKAVNGFVESFALPRSGNGNA
ncbi:hypothetical protein [Croceicoccus naphthovorans]|uniref:Uncharacterized protein n=1 Tax=Croceicoccus naphthovorans TaxID=1348774 RepID=A0A0G3XF80_9SPHN|nr:hypothetical protein [Croceicoccus naphthovorans]AKM09867.1 hypothetical protein AB433_07525 [Croceicoccus naphthovorans]MBB3991324.1 putative transcriptional regulator [Croceicoccus naphthovorans]